MEEGMQLSKCLKLYLVRRCYTLPGKMTSFAQFTVNVLYLLCQSYSSDIPVKICCNSNQYIDKTEVLFAGKTGKGTLADD